MRDTAGEMPTLPKYPMSQFPIPLSSSLKTEHCTLANFMRSEPDRATFYRCDPIFRCVAYIAQSPADQGQPAAPPENPGIRVIIPQCRGFRPLVRGCGVIGRVRVDRRWVGGRRDGDRPKNRGRSTVSAVVAEEQLFVLTPWTDDCAVGGLRHTDGVTTVLAEARPDHQQSAVGAAMEERAVGDKFPFRDRACPWCVGGLEEGDRLADALGPVRLHAHGAHHAIADLHPFVAIDQPVVAIAVDPRGAIKTALFGWRIGGVRYRAERAAGFFCSQHLSAASAFATIERDEEKPVIAKAVDLRRPDFLAAPETGFGSRENTLGFGPVRQITAAIRFNPDADLVVEQPVAALRVEMVEARVAIRDDERIPHADVGEFERIRFYPIVRSAGCRPSRGTMVIGF